MVSCLIFGLSTNNAIAEDFFGLGNVARLSLAKDLSDDWHASGSHSIVLDGSGTTFSSAFLRYKRGAYSFQFELANLGSEASQSRPNPLDNRVRAAVTHTHDWRQFKVSKKFRIEYADRDSTIGNSWRYRPSLALRYPTTFNQKPTTAYLVMEPVYDDGIQDFSFHIFSVGVTYYQTSSHSFGPSYLKVIVPGHDDVDHFVFSYKYKFKD